MDEAEYQAALAAADPMCRALLVDAHDFGFETGRDEGRAEFLWELWKKVDRRDPDVRDHLLERTAKMVRFSRWPVGVNRPTN